METERGGGGCFSPHDPQSTMASAAHSENPLVRGKRHLPVPPWRHGDASPALGEDHGGPRLVLQPLISNVLFMVCRR